MNKFVSWGHLAVAALFAIVAFADLSLALVRFLHSGHILEAAFREVNNSTNHFPVSAILFLACAWGILKWRTWAHTLAIVVCAVDLALLFLIPHTGGLSTSLVVLMLLFAATLLWLLMPSVRARFAKVI
jgi:hypothetical protein